MAASKRPAPRTAALKEVSRGWGEPDGAASGERNSLAEQAYRSLKSGIMHNTYPPGFRATEVEVASLLSMSRTPVREAMMRLQSEGLIEVTPRRGLRVLPIYPADLREIYELLCALEASAAELFARRGLPPEASEFAALIEVNERMATALAAGKIEVWAEMDERFHRGLVEQCGNRRITRVVLNVWDQSHRARLLTAPLRPEPTESYREHRAVLEAIQRGDERVAYELHRAHRTRGMTTILALLEQHQFGHL
jgi:DNA-binding GntR family transcriptional regulator